MNNCYFLVWCSIFGSNCYFLVGCTLYIVQFGSNPIESLIFYKTFSSILKVTYIQLCRTHLLVPHFFSYFPVDTPHNISSQSITWMFTKEWGLWTIKDFKTLIGSDLIFINAGIESRRLGGQSNVGRYFSGNKTGHLVLIRSEFYCKLFCWLFIRK